MPFAAAVAATILVGAGFGMVGAGLAGLTLSQVGHQDAGSAARPFNTAMQLGTALGIASASVVFFQYAPAGSRGATVTDAFAGSVRYVVAALAVMWALMLRLPRRSHGWGLTRCRGTSEGVRGGYGLPASVTRGRRGTMSGFRPAERG
ncbi:hypothetical protein ACFC1D_19260 [Streptomyces vinaceus]|uniref:hypothetical protein n=1 Tax=Streptomyces vinaceus TaxID=1960 RepID=UPI0035E31766